MKKFASLIIVLLWVSISFAGEGTIKDWRSKPLNYRVDLANNYVLKITGRQNMKQARALERCMKEATDDPKSHTYEIEQVAAFCMTLLGI